MKLSIIIVSYNTKILLKDCLHSIYKTTSENILKSTEIFVIDNASSDGSKEMIKKDFPLVLFVENKDNLGFAKANNIGIKKSKAEYILLLNSDTLIETGTIEKSLEFIESNKNIGVLGCHLKNQDGSVQYSAGFLPNIFNVALWMKFIDDIPFLKKVLHPYHIQDKSFYEKTQKTGWVSGAFFLIRKIAINDTGLLDESIFMYGEEVDLCMRMTKKRWHVYYYKDAAITHLKGASGSGDVAGLIEEFQTLKLIWKKHYPSWQMPFLRISLKIGALLRYVIFGILLGNAKKKNIYAKAFYLA